MDFSMDSVKFSNFPQVSVEDHRFHGGFKMELSLPRSMRVRDCDITRPALVRNGIEGRNTKTERSNFDGDNRSRDIGRIGGIIKIR
jgi:hypothetical protein